MMEDETVEEFRAKIKKLKDEVIYFKPSQKIKERYHKQRPMTAAEARGRSGWRRGLTLGGNVR